MADTPQPPITETGEQLLDIEIKGIVRRQEYERGGCTIRVLTPHAKSIGREIYACQAIFVPRDNMGNQAGPPLPFWFRVPAGNIEQAFERSDEALALAGPAFVERLKAQAQVAARRIITADKEPRFRRGGTGGDGNGDGRLRIP